MVVKQNPVVAVKPVSQTSSIPEVASEQKLSASSLDILKEKELEEVVPLEIKNSRLYVVSIFFSILIFAVVGVLLYAKLNYFKEDSKKVVEVKEETTSLVSPTPSSLAKGSIYLEILNGTGVVGEAGRIGKRIEELGYKVVKIGNAEKTDKTQVFINKSLDGKLGVLFADLKNEINVSSPSGFLEMIKHKKSWMSLKKMLNCLVFLKKILNHF